MRKIEPPTMTSVRTFECPGCGEAMAFVESCGAYKCDDCGLFFLDDRRSLSFSTEFEPIVEESKKHYDHAMMTREMDHFKLSKELLEKYSVGYLPFGFWAWRNADSKHGTLTFPMKNWKGKISNILGKHIGADEKLDFSLAIHKLDQRKFGVFNIEAFWEEDVHVYTNPTTCLKALEGGENAACICGKFTIPEIFAPTKVFVHADPPADDFIKDIEALAEVVKIG